MIRSTSNRFAELEPLSIPLPIAGEADRDVWGPAWEDQVAATLLWQEAQRAYRRRIAVRPAPAAAGGMPPPTLEDIARIATVVATLNERLLHLQSVANEVANAELSLRQRPRVLVPRRSDDEGVQGANVVRIRAAVRAWFETVAEAAEDLTALTGAAAPGGAVWDRGGAVRSASAAERRRRATVIDFPDRRATG